MRMMNGMVRSVRGCLLHGSLVIDPLGGAIASRGLEAPGRVMGCRVAVTRDHRQEQIAERAAARVDRGVLLDGVRRDGLAESWLAGIVVDGVHIMTARGRVVGVTLMIGVMSLHGSAP
jgi:hypothetical protein